MIVLDTDHVNILQIAKGDSYNTSDLKIASIAIVQGARLLSANIRDFEQVPGLSVEDWLH